MTSTDKNISRAKQVVDSWPAWKRNVQLTKYKPVSKTNSNPSLDKSPLKCG